MLELLASCFAGFHGAVHELRALRHVQFGRVPFQVVAAGGGDRAGSAKQSWARNRPFRDGLLDFNVAVAGAFGFHVAESGETLFEGPPRGESRSSGAQRNAGLQDIFVVAALGGILAPQENMCVRIDQSRQHRCAGKIDYLCSRWDGRGTFRYFFNALAARKNELVLARRFADAVNQRSGADYRQGSRASATTLS